MQRSSRAAGSISSSAHNDDFTTTVLDSQELGLLELKSNRPITNAGLKVRPEALLLQLQLAVATMGHAVEQAMAHGTPRILLLLPVALDLVNASVCL